MTIQFNAIQLEQYKQHNLNNATTDLPHNFNIITHKQPQHTMQYNTISRSILQHTMQYNTISRTILQHTMQYYTISRCIPTYHAI